MDTCAASGRAIFKWTYASNGNTASCGVCGARVNIVDRITIPDHEPSSR